MAAIPRFYKSHIAEGKGFLIISIIFAVCMRIAFVVSSNAMPSNMEGGYLWQLLDFFSGNPLYSLAVSSIIISAMAVLTAHINTDFVLIRRRTLLPPAIIILLFSCHPSLVWISPAYIGALCMLFSVSILFASYNHSEKSVAAFKITFILSLGSLFTPVLLLFVPLTWIALVIMRCFGFRSLLASFLGVFIVYFPTFSFYLFTDNLNEFLSPFLHYSSSQQLVMFPFLRFDIAIWASLIFIILFLSIIIGDNFLNRHKDKIKIRAYLSLLIFFTVLSLLFSIFINITPQVSLYIFMGVGSFLLSHFFALGETKGTVVLFYIFIVACLLFSGLSFLR